ncbi:conserved protein of unknown function [Tenacibaculum jejuense]|uniref:Uncharacterized protein n=1 Tax=Tenacibaculum jejuense TaxID=584609 RepID=A0A238UDD2_9FLAO|nr:conserved protein of unknown function [Tenacibaculum jejuense]
MNICKRKVQTLIDNVIKKGGGNRPYETLATLCSVKEGAKFYPKNIGIDNKIDFLQLNEMSFFLNNIFLYAAS